MVKRLTLHLTVRVWGALFFLLLASCRPATPLLTQTPGARDPTPTSAITQTAPQASPTPAPTEAPLAARVDGAGITLLEYQSELALYQAAKGTELAPEDEQRVLDDLIDQTLLAAAAEQKGFSVDDESLEARIGRLVLQMGSEQALAGWLDTYDYDEYTFRQALRRAVAAAWMRDQIAGGVPRTAEQVHARQILLYNSEEAAEIHRQLEAGNSFRNLALQYDPLTGGDLGWFPLGYLPDRNVEQAAFSLQPEEYSPVIETAAGFVILQVLETDPQRLLSPDALLSLQAQAVQTWLEQRRSEAQIEILAW
jgi:peptidyl-prolyl cis-trans isomerase C